MDSIGDARDSSDKTSITLSGGFSVETLTGVTLSWKTELNRSISAMEDRIPKWLQHCHETCYEKGGCHGRWACMVRRWFHCRNVISGQVDLYMTTYFQGFVSKETWSLFYHSSSSLIFLNIIFHHSIYITALLCTSLTFFFY